MRLFIDSADREAIRAALGTGLVYGVTTNPTLLGRANVRAADAPDLARQAIAWGAREVHMQVYAADAAGMLKQARQLLALDTERVVVKIPATPEGFRAAAELAHDNCPVTLTAVYTLRQALLAGSIGAQYVAVYLGRMRDAGLGALDLVRQMQALLGAQRLATTILAASIRDADEIVTLGLAGVGAATLPAQLIDRLVESEATTAAAATFGEDARAIQE